VREIVDRAVLSLKDAGVPSFLLLPEAAGRPVLFEGISCFHFRDGLIAHYREAFDRGLALVQLDFPAERIKRILEKAAVAQNRSPEARRHLARFSAE
jgi:hypothetical protein